MSFTFFMTIIFASIAVLFVFVGVLVFLKITRRAKDIERSLKMVPLLIKLPPLQKDETGSGNDKAELEQNINHAETIYQLFSGMSSGKKKKLYKSRHIALEIVAVGDQVYFYAIVPISLLSATEKALVAAYPQVQIEKVEDHNIFSDKIKLTGVAGGEFSLTKDAYYPINDYKKSGSDGLGAILTGLGKLGHDEGAGIQILIRPHQGPWADNARTEARNLLDPSKKKAKPSKTAAKLAMDIVKAPVVVPEDGNNDQNKVPQPPNEIDQKLAASIEEKASSAVFETVIRVVVSANDKTRAETLLHDVTSSFAQFNLPGSNGLKFRKAKHPDKIATDFVFRFFPAFWTGMILNTVELASLFHFPAASTSSSTAPVERTGSKEVASPAGLAPEGLIFGSNFYRGAENVIRLTDPDRLRHVYIVGQTGTGKSVTLENCVVQDMAAGKGLAFIDPHGDTAEKLLAKVPANRVSDVIYFNPADMEMPMGLNLLQFDRPEQKDFIIQETINMLYKLYDPGHTGIIGPRYEHWFRNAALTIMSDPEGATFLEIPKVFTDNDFLKQKFKYITDPTVSDFWTKEMAQTSDYHKSEMLGWFVSKFGAFASNDIMRNIIGQKKSSFDIRQIMDEGKILIVNLSKGLVGELNSQLLGMIFVIKFQAAAMGRSGVAENQRRDFTLYVDEFQNFSTDSFATILSEARKYHLSLIVANQFIGQLNEQVRDAVFGNVGTILSLRCGPEDAEFLAKQFSPSFDANDLVNLPNLNAALRLIVNGLPVTPFSLKILFPPIGQPNPEVAKAIIEYSRSHNGRPKAAVEAEIFSSLRKAEITQQPPISSKQPAVPAGNNILQNRATQTTSQNSPTVQAAPSPAPTVQ